MSKRSVDEVMGSVTGFDEIAIEQNFGIDVYIDGGAKPLKTLRALVFVHLRHEGSTDAEAKAQAMGMTSKEVNDFFAEEEEEVFDEEPSSPLESDDLTPG